MNKPEPDELEQWRRSHCTRWLIEQLTARRASAVSWLTNSEGNDLYRAQGRVRVLNEILKEIG